ncbi:MAG: Phenylalanyl-tRNA synthetase beta chain [uncultured Frankineae bacterium]|uniref:Phenylalanine--tRNA ligase beta subunit n=1 Tax=uncultured Frankineae bacterium TaxID=437475 RepID=A0A6J4LR86_9ACTN|nr:MAG: Phenylalanyl-tRNA synthetase beta chain [uncultured Frankineae bacterium]
MRVPVSWLRTLVPGLTASADEIAAALVRAGLEVEQVHRTGHDISSVVVGEVLDVEELTGFKKPIRYCHVSIGDRTHEVVCGATNFVAGDRVPFALPGAVLPGGTIARRKTYGHVSDGMICSAAELGLSDESDGILVLEGEHALGADVVELLSLRDEVLDIAVTPDRGYALSVRGVAREAATAYGLELADPGLVAVPEPTADGHPVRLDDPQGCDRYVARVVRGLDPAATSPAWLQRRLVLAGMRPISLAVDVTNAVMLETGQPLHAFDLDALSGEVVVRRAGPGERLTTLDGQDRELDPEDLLITDDRGPIALAGVMGGGPTEVTAGTTALLIEAAHFGARTIARTARRHRLPSEASRRYERGVDPALAPAAAQAAVRLLVELGGATAGPVTDVDLRPPLPRLDLPVTEPERLAGRPYAPEVVRRRLEDVGCTVSGGPEVLEVEPPSWRPDLAGRADLVEEVLRLEGYDTIPVVLPAAPSGRGLTPEQRLRRTASRALAAAGLVEVVLPPFVSESSLELLGGGTDAPRLRNPLSAEEALLRPTLLPGLLATVGRNSGRGLPDVAVFETGHVFVGAGRTVPAPGVDGPPTPDQRAALDAALPEQPRHVGIALAGAPASWDAAVTALVDLGRALGLVLEPRAVSHGPFHPGRTAELLLDGRRTGLAGELHPRVVAALGLPPRTCAAEANLDVLVAAAAAQGPRPAPLVSHFPPASVDVALVVADDVPAADVERALRDGAGDLLEGLRLFDVYVGPQVGEGRRSLAYGLRLRAPDRVLTGAEILAARDAALERARADVGAELRT